MKIINNNLTLLLDMKQGEVFKRPHGINYYMIIQKPRYKRIYQGSIRPVFFVNLYNGKVYYESGFKKYELVDAEVVIK